MPIKPENRGRYPANWRQIRAGILERAGNRCEACRVPQYAVAQWDGERWKLTAGNAYHDQLQYAGSYREARELAAHNSEYWEPGDPKWIVIVLTVAHLDHTPENCDPANLRAWCQRCHLRYDAKFHQANAAKTRKARKAVGDLFERLA